MKKNIFILWILISLLAAACSGADREASENTPPPAAVLIVTHTPGLEDSPLTPQAEAGATSPVKTSLVSECTLVSASSEPSDAYADLFAVTEADWSVGPDDAAVILIEYGDFQ